MIIREATPADAGHIVEIFWGQLTRDPSYISHGEIQMGIADGPGTPAPDGRAKWEKYLFRNMEGSDSLVLVAEQDGATAGFLVAEITDDSDEPYGVLCDVVVDPGARGRGLGSALMDNAIEWLHSRGISEIYLESGLDNHSAHELFKKKGFGAVSYVFRKL